MKSIRRFTLVELLVVMAIIAILSAIGFGVYTYTKSKAQESATEALLGQINAGLKAFNADQKYFPSSGGEFKTIKFKFNADGTVSEIDFGGTGGKLTYDSSTSLTAKEREKNRLIELFTKAVDMEVIKSHLTPPDSDGVRELVDAWGGKIYYRSPGKFNQGSYDLISAGRDGVFGQSKTNTPGDTRTDYRENAGEKVCDDLFNF